MDSSLEHISKIIERVMRDAEARHESTAPETAQKMLAVNCRKTESLLRAFELRKMKPGIIIIVSEAGEVIKGIVGENEQDEQRIRDRIESQLDEARNKELEGNDQGTASPRFKHSRGTLAGK